MKFTTARLCGGKAMMAVSADVLDIDMDAAESYFREKGCEITSKDPMMLVFRWNDMDTTLYSQGKVMFFPLEDKQLCIKYATEILEALVG